MAARKRKNLLPRRRRHDDEGEDDGSTAGEPEHYASSEASLGFDVDETGAGSAHSAAEDQTKSVTASPRLSTQKPLVQSPSFPPTADTAAMLRGLKLSDRETGEELGVNEGVADAISDNGQQASHSLVRSKSMPMQHTRQRGGSKPPTQPRKGYFLHDDRHTSPAPAQSAGRGRGRGVPSQDHRGQAAGGSFRAGSDRIHSNFGTPVSDTTKAWVHDLHETINQPAGPAQPAPSQSSALPPTQPAAGASTAPNRSFSTTTVLGNVPVNVSIPGVDKKTSASMVKKHYTLLPQHRPPLRRDKPVRISIPNEHPRYIFPSTDRSFIFIPRAMRPNQQQFRGRGRGSFHGSRRPSMFGGSTYTPSVGMSRRPSIAASIPGSGIHTPTGSTYAQYPLSMQKPVVRMPGTPAGSFAPTVQNAEVYLGDNSAIIHSPPATLPMHQPIPHKAVSVDQIESPTMTAPQQQPQQPFHQQIPSDLHGGQPQHKMPHIPEGAVYAQPFQPYPAFQHHGYYGFPYPMQPVDPVAYGYNMGMGGPVMPTPGSSGHVAPQQQGLPGPVPHESNGMVYYYDPSQQHYMAPQMMMGVNVMPPGPGTYHYPPMQNQMFYQ